MVLLVELVVTSCIIKSVYKLTLTLLYTNTADATSFTTSFLKLDKLLEENLKILFYSFVLLCLLPLEALVKANFSKNARQCPAQHVMNYTHHDHLLYIMQCQ